MIINKTKKKKMESTILKWVGGKRKLIDKISKHFPKTMKKYHEPFIGGGSVLLFVLEEKSKGNLEIQNEIICSDLNFSLINFYQKIQSELEDFLEIFKKFSEIYHQIKKTKDPMEKTDITSSKELYYYHLREKFNQMEKDTTEAAAIFLFLNRTSFRGMYREGPSGFNVPFGNYDKVSVTESDIKRFSEKIQDVIFLHRDFRKSLSDVSDGDFVYLDPPYVKTNKNSFVGYLKTGFTEDCHKDLFSKLSEIDGLGVKFVISNSRTDLIKKHLEAFQSEEIVARRAINSKNPGEQEVELIIWN